MKKRERDWEGLESTDEARKTPKLGENSAPAASGHDTPEARISALKAKLDAVKRQKEDLYAISELMSRPIDTVEDCKIACARLRRCEKIGVDGEWTGRGRDAKLSLLQVSFPVTESGQVGVYLFDTFVGGKSMCEDGDLKALLEDSKVTKVMHDCRLDSDVLYHSFGIKLNNVLDTQVLYYFHFTQLRPFSPLPVSLKTVLRKFADREDNTLKDEAHALMEENDKFWEIRPMTPLMLKYAREDVLFLLEAFRRLWTGLDPRNQELAVSASNDYAHQVRSMKTFPHDRYGPNVLPSYGVDSWDRQARSHWEFLAIKYPTRFKPNNSSETPTEAELERIRKQESEKSNPTPTVAPILEQVASAPKQLFFPSQVKKAAPPKITPPPQPKMAPKSAPAKIYATPPKVGVVKKTTPKPAVNNDFVVMTHDDFTSSSAYRR